jgi:hypothetical protein
VCNVEIEFMFRKTIRGPVVSVVSCMIGGVVGHCFIYWELLCRLLTSIFIVQGLVRDSRISTRVVFRICRHLLWCEEKKIYKVVQI